MPRYFFNIEDGETILDELGVELSGPEGARAQAVIASGEILKDKGRNFWGGGEWRMWVTDESGVTICALRFSAECSFTSPLPSTRPMLG